MKNVKLIVVIVIVAIFANGLSAEEQNNNFNWTKAEKQNFVNIYTQSLNNSNDGVAESALMNVIKMKLENPNLNFKKATKTIVKLKNRNDGIEYYKLVVAETVMEKSESFTANQDFLTINNIDTFFNELTKDVNIKKYVLATL